MGAPRSAVVKDTILFALALERLGAETGRCLFVGDHPRWDLAGACAAGMEAILVQRAGDAASGDEASIPDLYGVLQCLRIRAQKGKI